jgi:hypothetical protein
MKHIADIEPSVQCEVNAYWTAEIDRLRAKRRLRHDLAEIARKLAWCDWRIAALRDELDEKELKFEHVFAELRRKLDAFAGTERDLAAAA